MPQPEGAEQPVPTEASSPVHPALRSVSSAEDSVHGESPEGTRQEKRSRRKKKERERMPQHGKGLAQIYKDALTKRTKPKSPPGD
ncbi:MAG: hypothetical protein HY676_05540 [Chloroflexi bacterium]|nr:hypothetical protein [Chloroflexota bacterium]